MTRDPRHNTDVNDAGMDDFADRFDQQWNATVGSQEEAFRLDPALWDRIRRSAVPGNRPSRRRRRQADPDQLQVHHPRETHRVPDVQPAVPPARWHRGLLLFAAVVVIGGLVVFMPGGSISPRQGSMVREAPQVVTPISGEELGCNVVPLTRDEVLAIVLDPEGRGFTDDRALFATPPPEAYPHTRTWLPEANGTVDMAGGPRPVRLPTTKEFEESKSALDRYLRCQSEGTNFQLWALESPVEVQRQVLVLAQALLHPGDAQSGLSSGVDDLTETKLLQTIDQVGPDLRSANDFNVYMFFLNEESQVESNPDRGAALVADNPETEAVEYAWIALRWVDPETGDVISTRGASLEATPTSPDGTIPNLVVMILRYDTPTNSWLVEWFVPTI